MDLESLRASRYAVIAALLVLPACAKMSPTNHPDFVEVIARASPAVVAIAGATETFGSGFLIAPNRVVTAAHVARAAGASLFVLAAARRIEGKVIASNDGNDVALIEIATPDALPALKLAAAQPRVGEWVSVLGNPFGAGVTATVGIVSAAAGTITATPELTRKLQINAAVNAGNSGGPICNVRGEVIGIASALVPGGQGLAFVTTADAIRDMLAGAR
jgi:serine protease Do